MTASCKPLPRLLVQAACLIAVRACLADIPAEAPGWPAFPTPAKAQVSWVAEDLRYNNVPMQIRLMNAAEQPADIIGFYQKLWTENGAKVSVMRLPPWVVLAQTRGAYHFTVQTRAVPGGSESTLAISRLPEMIQQAKLAKAGMPSEVRKLGEGFPMMSGSKVGMDMESYDQGKQARTIMHRNTFPVEDNALYLREQLLLQSWTRVSDHSSADGKSRVIVFRRDHQELILTLSRRGNWTEIFSNQTEAG